MPESPADLPLSPRPGADRPRDTGPRSLSRAQRIGLLALRTLVGWHFLYEGYFKIVLPAWSRDGAPLAAWSSLGYMRGGSGPLVALYWKLAALGAIPWIDGAVELGLLLVGLSLMLGLFTQLGCYGALGLLTLFYLVAVPLAGVPQPGAEGAYLLVDKNLVELAAVVVLLSFRTGELAGLDRLRIRRRVTSPAA